MQDADPINPQRVFWELNKYLPDDAIISLRLGLVRQLVRPRREARSGHDGVALGNARDDGAGCARTRSLRSSRIPDRPAVALVGDGAMQMNGMAELITAAKYYAPLDRSAARRARAATTTI